MSTISKEHSDRLFWLGRYTERLFITLRSLDKLYDRMIDEKHGYKEFLGYFGLIDTYKDKFRTEPNTLYAGVAHDIMLYFSTALWRQGAEFWRNPQKFSAPSGMLFPFSLKQPSPTGGYENQYPDIYQMVNFKLTPIQLY